HLVRAAGRSDHLTMANPSRANLRKKLALELPPNAAVTPEILIRTLNDRFRRIEDHVGVASITTIINEGSAPPPTPAPQTIDVIREVPAGVKDGVNRIFTLSFQPDPQWSLILVRNNLVQNPYVPPNFVLDGATITYAVAMEAIDEHVAWYIKGAAAPDTEPHVAGQARQFAGGTDKIDWGNSSVFNLHGDMSFGAWVKLPSNTMGAIVSRGFSQTTQDTNDAFKLGVFGNAIPGRWDFVYGHDYGVGGLFEFYQFAVGVPSETWLYVGFSRDAAAKTVSVFIGDGDIIQTIAVWAYTNAPDGGTSGSCKLQIGNYAGGAAPQTWSQPLK